MKKLIFLILALPFLSLPIGCGHKSKMTQALDMAEYFMDAHPDSALQILQSIDTNDLRKVSDKALYGLLITQAMEKNRQDPRNDSLISFATDYYMSGKDSLKQVMANYYHGAVQYNDDNYPAAILSFFIAKEIAEECDLDFWAGMACRSISDIYNDTYNSAEEVTYAAKE